MGTEPNENLTESTAGNSDAVLLDDVVNSDTPTMPDVQDHAIQAMQSRLEEQTTSVPTATQAGGPVKGQTDSQGRPFDPAIHESPMRINTEGYIACKRGRASGGKNAANRSFVSQEALKKENLAQQSPEKIAQAAKIASENEAKFKAAGDTSAALFETVGILVLGDEFRPENTKEHDSLALCFEGYYRSKGCPDLPPGLVLACGLIVYTARRWNAPKIAEKRATWWTSIKRWWNDFKFRRSQQ